MAGKDNRIDADKIVRHINYTKHWLDKANSDFQDKNFSSGSAVLNLARAELTAAWEEALQLKNELFTQIPKKARANWKPAASAGLLASGFMIAIILYQFTGGRVQQAGISDSSSKTPAIVLPQTVETPVTTETVVPEKTLNKVKRVVHPATSKTANKENNVETDEVQTIEFRPSERSSVSIPPFEHEERPAQEPMPYSTVTPQASEEQTQPVVNKTSELNQSDVIELYKTAERSLRK